MTDQPPKTISALWYMIDKRLALIEAAQTAHCDDHTRIKEVIDDHETRIRSGLTMHGVLTGGGGILSLVAIIKSFMP